MTSYELKIIFQKLQSVLPLEYVKKIKEPAMEKLYLQTFTNCKYKKAEVSFDFERNFKGWAFNTNYNGLYDIFSEMFIQVKENTLTIFAGDDSYEDPAFLIKCDEKDVCGEIVYDSYFEYVYIENVGNNLQEYLVFYLGNDEYLYIGSGSFYTQKIKNLKSIILIDGSSFALTEKYIYKLDPFGFSRPFPVKKELETILREKIPHYPLMFFKINELWENEEGQRDDIVPSQILRDLFENHYQNLDRRILLMGLYL